MEQVLLVDYNDYVIGREEKLRAHEEALLHRAFSVFLYQDDQILIHKRASSKYHCGGLWTNTCCSHPRQDEPVLKAASRRLMEELSIDCKEEDLEEIHSFVYRYEFSNGLTEFEFDHVIVGEYHGTWVENPEEVDEVRWVKIPELLEDIRIHGSAYTPWFIVALGSVVNYLKTKNNKN